MTLTDATNVNPDTKISQLCCEELNYNCCKWTYITCGFVIISESFRRQYLCLQIKFSANVKKSEFFSHARNWE